MNKENNDYYYYVARVNIKKYRKLKGYTAQELADKTGLTHQFIRDLESLKITRRPRLDTLVNIANALNEVLKDSKVTILLETMAGKGTEVGSSFEEISQIINLLDDKSHIGVCMDTCHMNDAGYDLEDFDKLLD